MVDPTKYEDVLKSNDLPAQKTTMFEVRAQNMSYVGSLSSTIVTHELSICTICLLRNARSAFGERG